MENEELEFDESLEEPEEIDTITLEAEDGTEHEFEILAVIEYNGSEYYGLMPYFEKTPEYILEDSAELIILKSVEDGGENYLEEIEDADELQIVGDLLNEEIFADEDYDILED